MNENKSQAEVLQLSKEAETEGFDLQAGQSWIYPTNYPLREYQFNIIQKALLKNTLVSLPTGLGKTFIAAVVMYNFYRWYPLGKIVFMAPTRPLVKQQVDACYDIMAIPKECTIELTGSKVSATRDDIWSEKRVFFVTPQILQNDLEKFPTLASKIKCLVFDEAHRARGNHAYCEVIRRLVDKNKYFRVLALSATPGGTTQDVLEVIQNLLISQLEVRTEESPDVSSYVFNRNLTTVVVPLSDKLEQVRDEYLKILDFNTRSLVKYKVIQGHCANLTKGKIFMIMKELQRNRTASSPNYGEIMKCLNICITLYHGYDLLIRHGLRSFLVFFEEHKDKPLLRNNLNLFTIVDDVANFLGPIPNIEMLPDGDYPVIPKDVKFGHPKFYKLREILENHFEATNTCSTSRVIVFFEYRESVMEAYALLIQSRPLIKPRFFLGQKGGITQRVQINVVRAFREGTCNVLLSTCIGEEGLDVGEVDLIICFDISNKSPIRMVQRMGRTGRKKEGSIIVLVTEGKEQQTLKDCLIHKNNVACHVLGSKVITEGLLPYCPRLVPENVTPKCERIFITVQKPVLNKKSSLKDMFRNISSNSASPTFSQQDIQFIDIIERIPEPIMLFNKDCPLETDNNPLISNRKIEKQRILQDYGHVKHSKKSKMLVDLLKYADSKRFNIPMSQIASSSETLSQNNNKNFKQTDIRNMFIKSQSCNDFADLEKKVETREEQPLNTEEKTSTIFGSKELFNELAAYLAIEGNFGTTKCSLCPDCLDCSKLASLVPPATLNSCEPLDMSVYTQITLEDLKAFTKSLDNDGVNVRKNDQVQFDDSVDFAQLQRPPQKIELAFDELIDQSIFGVFLDKSLCNFEAPKTLGGLLNKYNNSIVESEQNTQVIDKVEAKAEILRFFKLDSFNEMFNVVEENEGEMIENTQATIIYSAKSPDLFQSESPEIDKSVNPVIVEDEGSPILCTFDSSTLERKRALKRSNSKRSDLFATIDTPSKFTMDRTKLSSTPKISSTVEPKIRNVNAETLEAKDNKQPDNIDLDDLFDMSSFFDATMSDKNVERTNLKSLTTTNNFNSTVPSQISITQMISVVNKTQQQQKQEKQEMNSSQKENQRPVVLTEDSLFDFSFLEQEKEPEGVSTVVSSSRKIINNHHLSEHVNENNSPKKTINNRMLVNENETFVEIESSPELIPNLEESIRNLSANLSRLSNDNYNSDDEFETRPTRLKKKVVNEHQQLFSSPSSNSARKRRKKLTDHFIEKEAEVSFDGNIACSSDEDDDNPALNCYEASFVADESHIVSTQMHARYLQSIRSPNVPCRFKIPRRPNNSYMNVFSQDVVAGEETQENFDDSFVVHEEEVSASNELSQLEILEKQLEQRRKKRKQKHNSPEPTRKRIKIINSFSDDSS